MIQILKHANSISGTPPIPGDKSISHRYAILAAIAEGTSVLEHFAASQDCRSTLRCLKSVGVKLRESGETVEIHGCGLRGLQSPNHALDAGNSGTTMRLLTGVLAGHPFRSTITGDTSLRKRPMGRIIHPLREMGVDIEASRQELPPLTIQGGVLKGIRYRLPVASAQVKSCVLFAGLYGDGCTAVEETTPTRDHTEIALREFGAAIRFQGNWIEVAPEAKLRARHLVIPGDLSGGAFFIVAAAMIPDSDIRLQRIGLNRRRRELLNYLMDAGLDLAIENEADEAGEPRGDLLIRYSPTLLEQQLPAIRGGRVAALIDEIPALCVLGSRTAGGLEISDAQELRVKESDRISALADNLRLMGADVREKPDGLIIPGSQRLHGADIVTRSDHRVAMAFAVAGLLAQGETRIHEAECVDVSFPGFWDVLRQIAK